MMDNAEMVSTDENRKVEAALATSVQLYKAGNLTAARNALLSGMGVLDKTDFRLAVDAYQKLVAIDFDLADKSVLMSDMKSYASYLSSNNAHDKAVTVLQTAHGVDPDDSDISFLLAKTVIGGGDLPLGIPMLKRVLETESTNFEALELFIKSSMKYRPDQALPYIQRYLDKNAERPDAYIDAAGIFEQLGLGTESINARQKATEKFTDNAELERFLESSVVKYPTEPFFHGRLLEIAISKNDVQAIDSHLSQLARIMKNKEDWRSALGFIELRLLVDPKNRNLVDEAKGLRLELGYQRSPLDFDESVDSELAPSRRKLLFMDWSGYFADLTEKIQDAITNCDRNKQLSLRREWLKTENLRQIVADRFDGTHKMPDELWAHLLSDRQDVEEMKHLYKKFPNQINVVKALLGRLGDDRFSVNSVWLDFAGNAAKRGDWVAVAACIQLLASTNDSLAPYISVIKPIVSETLR
jgi:tetratricopeptide (TPR) repeat protein